MVVRRASDTASTGFNSASQAITTIGRVQSYSYGLAQLGMTQRDMVMGSSQVLNEAATQLLIEMDSTSKSASATGATTSKQYYSTNSPFEAKIGYYRGVRHGQHIWVSGTTAVDPKSSVSAPQILFPDDARQQTRVALEESIKAVKALGGGCPENVVRVRMFVSRDEDCGAVGEGFREVLGRNGEVGTTATMVVVKGFIDERMLVEVEVEGYVG